MPSLGASMSMTRERSYDFGVSVNITPPPADQTIGYLEFHAVDRPERRLHR